MQLNTAIIHQTYNIFCINLFFFHIIFFKMRTTDVKKNTFFFYATSYIFITITIFFKTFNFFKSIFEASRGRVPSVRAARRSRPKRHRRERAPRDRPHTVAYHDVCPSYTWRRRTVTTTVGMRTLRASRGTGGGGDTPRRPKAAAAAARGLPVGRSSRRVGHAGRAHTRPSRRRYVLARRVAVTVLYNDIIIAVSRSWLLLLRGTDGRRWPARVCYRFGRRSRKTKKNKKHTRAHRCNICLPCNKM